ncbi:DUF6069 family protein [Cellulomonas sp. HZM]|uniref:DUF6069 family protein n=1 Tax=Cellulomonas sp. HZM TaxID=1454010 RepID=UPI0004932E23|nr:DUF6069 family protein [Cellulomonas sp. HZM]
MTVPPSDPQPTQRFTTPPAAATPPAADGGLPPTPPALQPTAAEVPAPAPARPAEPRLTLNAGQYWGGVVATAVVAALVGVVGVVVFEKILDVDLVVQDPFGTDSHLGAYVVGGVAAALLAGGLLHLLVVSTPRPRAFFGWIVGLATLVVALLPLTWTDDTTRALCSGLVNLVMGIAIWSLLASVLARTTRIVGGR